MDKHQDTLIKLLLQASSRYDLWRVFSDFLFASAAAISNAVDLTQAKAREEQYKKVMERYDKETRMLFPQMMAELTLALQDAAESGRFRDVLGDTFHQLNLQNEWKGQFFTPQSVADLMGEITISSNADIMDHVKHYGYVSLYEPACGAGATVFGFLNGYYRLRPKGNHSREVAVCAGDIDERCVWMCYIQCALYGLPAIIEQRNALTMELAGTWYTPLYIWHGWAWKIKKARSIRIADAEALKFFET